MSDAEWALVKDLLPVPGRPTGRGGGPESYRHADDRRGAPPRRQWHQVAGDACHFPPSPRVYVVFTRLRDAGLVGELRERLREAGPAAEGRSPEPSAAVVDSQPVKADAISSSTAPGTATRPGADISCPVTVPDTRATPSPSPSPTP
jgi:transposase